MKLLLVDDDELILELLAEGLSLSGHADTTLASSGREALQRISEVSWIFDAIFLDIQMPELDGIELCRLIRAIPGYRSVPIIMVTAMQDKGHVNSAFAAGANDYITKPFDPFEVDMRLRNNLELSEVRKKNHNEAQAQAAHLDLAPRDDKISSPSTLRNYLQQLSRCSAEHTVFAIQISNFNHLLSELSSDAVISILDAVSHVLRYHMDEQKHLFSYCSNGVFLCVNQGPSGRFDSFFLSSLECAINRFDVPMCKAAPNIEISMGRVVRCRKFRNVDTDTVIAQALDPFHTDKLPGASQRTRDISEVRV